MKKEIQIPTQRNGLACAFFNSRNAQCKGAEHHCALKINQFQIHTSFHFTWESYIQPESISGNYITIPTQELVQQ